MGRQGRERLAIGRSSILGDTDQGKQWVVSLMGFALWLANAEETGPWCSCAETELCC